LKAIIKELSRYKLIAPPTLYNLQKKYAILSPAVGNFLILREIYQIKGEDFWKRMVRDLNYNEYMNSIYWNIIKQYVWYSNRKCLICGLKKHLQVHHKNYFHLGYEILHLEDLELLCFRCHTKEHGKEDSYGGSEKLYEIWRYLYLVQKGIANNYGH